MINKFNSLINQLHDARVFVILFDNNPLTYDLNLILYVQIFSDFESEKYTLEKGLIVFEEALIDNFSIIKDLSYGQFFITGIDFVDCGNGRFNFIFTFDDSIIKLALSATNINLIMSGIIEQKNEQFLSTEWKNLLF